MEEREVARYWDQNARSWTDLARAGYDVYRDVVNTPGFLELLPPIAGLTGLDVGCGDGHNTRMLMEAGARMYAVDIAPAFVRAALEREMDRPDRIRYLIANGAELPLESGSFDFVTAFMSLMDMPRPWLGLSEAYRVLRRDGFLQFSITHPCFTTPHRKLLRDARGKEYAVEVGRYFDRIDGRIDEWLFSAAPQKATSGVRPFQVPQFHRTLSDWMNMILDAGFRIERLAEPFADEETAARCPKVRDTRVVAYFLHVRCRKV